MNEKVPQRMRKVVGKGLFCLGRFIISVEQTGGDRITRPKFFVLPVRVQIEIELRDPNLPGPTGIIPGGGGPIIGIMGGPPM